MKIANRKAKDERESRLSALEAYANLGDKPNNWKRFHLKYPDFFPQELREWFYRFAETNYERTNDHPEVRTILRPPLLFYSDRLRLVWSRNDPDGRNLKLLYGFEKEASGLKNEGASPIMPGDYIGRIMIPGQSRNEDKQNTLAGLPPGKPIVNVVTGLIDWEFGCALQQSVYDLMQQRWRAMVCPECGKFFLADKTNQKFCSTVCFGEVKRKRALEHWRLKGSDDRKRRAKKARSK